MSYTRVLRGLGTLVIDTTLCAGVGYRIFFRDGSDGLPEIVGVIEGRDHVLWEAFNAQDARLRLEDGTEIGIRVVLYSPGLGSADIVTTTPKNSREADEPSSIRPAEIRRQLLQRLSQ